MISNHKNKLTTQVRVRSLVTNGHGVQRNDTIFWYLNALVDQSEEPVKNTLSEENILAIVDLNQSPHVDGSEETQSQTQAQRTRNPNSQSII
jgi:hypothetical protein